ANEEKPPRRNPAAQANEALLASAFDGVRTLAVRCLGGRHSQPHLLAHRAGQEAANGMRLPTSSFHQLFRGGPARPLEQVQDFGGLAALAGACRRLRLSVGFGRFVALRDGAGLLPRLPPWRARHGASVRECSPSWSSPLQQEL